VLHFQQHLWHFTASVATVLYFQPRFIHIGPSGHWHTDKNTIPVMRLQCKQSEFKSTRHKIVKRCSKSVPLFVCSCRNKVVRQGCLIQLSWIRFTRWALAVCMFREAIGCHSHHHVGSLHPWWQEAMVKCMISSNLYTLRKFVEFVVVNLTPYAFNNCDVMSDLYLSSSSLHSRTRLMLPHHHQP